ncbi:MAG: hypothetical protein IJI54_02420, partial [Kiritimatiellae bacterium]|nr:hypothetical protein [Kiritimatiellia bacterium]
RRFTTQARGGMFASRLSSSRLSKNNTFPALKEKARSTLYLYNSPPHPLMMGSNLSETTSLCGGQPPADSRTPCSYTARRKNCFCKLFQLFQNMRG